MSNRPFVRAIREITRVRIVPKKTGHFPSECDVFCGSSHDDMGGELIVVD